MRIALISPYSIGAMRGNITTVRRIDQCLNKAHIETLVLAADVLSVEEMVQRLLPFSPTLIHGFHARYCGEIAVILADRLQVPSVITITGSDLHDPALRDHPATVTALARAAAITCFCTSEADELVARFPRLPGRVAVVSQGAEALPDSGRRDFGIPGDCFAILLPAALRPVKNVEFAIAATEKLWQVDTRFRLVIAGGEIDRSYAHSIRSMLDVAPWARWLGEVPHEEMGALYRRADLVINCSIHEGMPNSLMEAMALGRPVAAVDIPGNRPLVRQGDTGWLFDDESTFRTLVVTLAGDKMLRQEIGTRAREYVEANLSPYAEVEKYRNLYRSLV
ncbi:glycosyltransferase family 4 protein [Oryzomonas sagensis]|uniref:Glycosyltransferase family 4 protein n=1 Tax=Oryzomonas sagensis TaxID=2603857 RepID=A0ABQ6TNS4_9BACT|nr:glycosyltransferase [Oryzomonas sagensis]KAB0669875.1 glycosyltransferase family 4 protein [Oryzomonas sagensis]